MEEKVELEKNKNNKWLIVLCLTLLLLCIGMGAFIFIKKDIIFGKESQTVSVKEKDVSKEGQEPEKDETNEEVKSVIKNLSLIIFEKDKSHLEVNDIDKEKLINDLVTINKNGSITDVTGTRLKELALQYFNISNLELVNITCGWDHNNQGTNVMYIYNPNTDKYEYNDNHAGHGGGNTGISVYRGDDEVLIEDDYYIYTTHVFYKDNGCVYDTCGPLEKLDIYYSYEEAFNKTNKVMSAVNNENLCKKESVGYNCDDEKIYEAIKDNTKIAKFYYKKINDNFVFEKYIVE